VGLKRGWLGLCLVGVIGSENPEEVSELSSFSTSPPARSKSY